MPKQAQILDDRRLRQAIEACRGPRDRVILLLSVKAGLRAKEIAGLAWDRVDLDGGKLMLTETKGGKPRTVPIHPDLRDALIAYRAERGDKAKGPVLVNTNAKPGQPLTPGAIAVWFNAFYNDRLGWPPGYSSHSGRRTFVTRAARNIHKAGGSLKDVQALAGHADLKTTALYIETDPEAQRNVVNMI
jgi:integrase/recombinase XerD